MRRPAPRTTGCEHAAATAVAAALVAFTASTATYVVAIGSSAASFRLEAASSLLVPLPVSPAASSGFVRVDPHPALFLRDVAPPAPQPVPGPASRGQSRPSLTPAPAPAAPVPAAPAPAAVVSAPAAPVRVRAPVPAPAPAPAPARIPVPAPAAPAPVAAYSASVSGLGAPAVALAAQQAGTPYVYGGASPGGFDCSGLTSYVYGRLGRYLPHNTDAQYAVVAHIPLADMAPGDLVFFGSPGASSHVGIYAGNNMIWHAPSPGGVVRLDPIWGDAFMGGRP